MTKLYCTDPKCEQHSKGCPRCNEPTRPWPSEVRYYEERKSSVTAIHVPVDPLPITPDEDGSRASLAPRVKLTKEELRALYGEGTD